MALWDGTAITVAQALIGATLATKSPSGVTSVTISEAEAYGGIDDPASHARRGQTERNSPMFGPAGTLYVYRSYGIHWCLNVVTGAVGDPQAVLIRAGIPQQGLDLMVERRGRCDHLVDGPGKLTQALGIDNSLDGRRIEQVDWLSITAPDRAPMVEWKPRVGLTKAAERRWRCVLLARD
ncbi:MAG: DNA-3-methyladenine glycosylase [Acidimicrobiia bacterium]|nr:DNA-3-methyladenine glycosylase [Acidimicrobiia bacterium]